MVLFRTFLNCSRLLHFSTFICLCLFCFSCNMTYQLPCILRQQVFDAGKNSYLKHSVHKHLRKKTKQNRILRKSWNCKAEFNSSSSFGKRRCCDLLSIYCSERIVNFLQYIRRKVQFLNSNPPNFDLFYFTDI